MAFCDGNYIGATLNVTIESDYYSWFRIFCLDHATCIINCQIDHDSNFVQICQESTSRLYGNGNIIFKCNGQNIDTMSYYQEQNVLKLNSEQRDVLIVGLVSVLLVIPIALYIKC